MPPSLRRHCAGGRSIMRRPLGLPLYLLNQRCVPGEKIPPLTPAPRCPGKAIERQGHVQYVQKSYFRGAEHVAGPCLQWLLSYGAGPLKDQITPAGKGPDRVNDASPFKEEGAAVEAHPRGCGFSPRSDAVRGEEGFDAHHFTMANGDGLLATGMAAR